MANFDNTEEEEDEAEDGWTKVGKKKTVRMTEEEQNQAKQKVAKKRKKQQLVSFGWDPWFLTFYKKKLVQKTKMIFLYRIFLYNFFN